MRSRCLLLFLLLAGTALADPAEDVLRLDRELSVATWAGDVAWFEENLDEAYVLVTPAGTVRTRRDVIRELVKPGLKMEPYECTETDVRVYGDTGIVTGRFQQSFTLGRALFRNDLRYTNVYVKRKGRWILASAHTSAVK